MIRSTVITDASFDDRCRAAGWAAWINVNWPDGKHERIKHSGMFHERPKNSTDAELWATLNGIWFAVQQGATEILVQTDCMSVVQKHGPIEARKHFKGIDITWRHVKGHNLKKVNDRRTFVNDWCDREAKKHMKSQRGY